MKIAVLVFLIVAMLVPATLMASEQEGVLSVPKTIKASVFFEKIRERALKNDVNIRFSVGGKSMFTILH